MICLVIRLCYISFKNNSGEVWGVGENGHSWILMGSWECFGGFKDGRLEVCSTAENLWLTIRMWRADNQATEKKEKHFWSHRELGLLQLRNSLNEPKPSLEARTHLLGHSGQRRHPIFPPLLKRRQTMFNYVWVWENSNLWSTFRSSEKKSYVLGRKEKQQMKLRGRNKKWHNIPIQLFSMNGLRQYSKHGSWKSKCFSQPRSFPRASSQPTFLEPQPNMPFSLWCTEQNKKSRLNVTETLFCQ